MEKVEEYKSKIIELVNSIEEESVLRRIYLILITMILSERAPV